jgi:hypothetical protein
MKRSTSIWEKEKAQPFGRMKRSTNIREYEKEPQPLGELKGAQPFGK